MKTIHYLVFFLFAIFVSPVAAQTDSTFFAGANAAVAKQLPQEKVYLHLNKPAYDFADTIWYKAYVVVGQHHQLSALSGVLYVELISPNDTLIIRQTLKLNAGIAANAIPLAPTLAQGLYRLRAYTKWMRNAGTEYFYDQQIRIGGIAPLPVSSVKPVAQKPDIQFFPEGGELLIGVRSRVAFKAINSKGLGEEVSGTVEDSEGNIVADLTTRHLGMGVFAFIPQSGKIYNAKVKLHGESVYTIALPPAKEAGYTLSVNNNRADSLFIKVTANDKLLAQKPGSAFYLLAQSAGKIYYTAKGTLAQPVYMAAVDKARFPSGIVQFTLFDADNLPIAERVAFIQGADSLKLELSASNKTYSPGRPVKFNLNSAVNAKAASGTFSVAVVNDNIVSADEGTIFNNLLLTSDLNGNIEQPNYYFGNNPQANADLDLLMLTQGYHRFEWKRALSVGSVETNYEAEMGLEIAGVLQTAGGKPIANGKINLISTRDNVAMDTLAGPAGEFRFTGLDLSDTSKVILRARNGNNAYNINVFLKAPVFEPISKRTMPDSVYSLPEPSFAPKLLNAGRQYRQNQKQDSLVYGKTLKQVTIRSRAVKPEAPSVYNRFGAATPDFQISGKRLIASNLSMALQMGLRFISYRNGKFFSPRNGKQYHIIVDEHEIEPEQINMYGVEDIENVKMSDIRPVTDKILYGVMDTDEVNGGLIIITTKMHAGTKAIPRSKQKEVTLPDGNRYLTNDPASGFMAYNFRGFTPVRTFYMPKYSVANPLPDTRTAVYWNPDIVTDKDGNATIEYLNSDIKGNYRLVVEGIDGEGNLGRKVYQYKVE